MTINEDNRKETKYTLCRTTLEYFFSAQIPFILSA